MAEWLPFTPAGLFPSEMEAILGPISSAASVLGTSLDLFADIVDIVSLFVQGLLDPNEGLIAATQALIDAVIQALLSTGGFMLTHIPDSAALKIAPSVWLKQVSSSFDDTFDENRPLLIDPGAFVGAICVLGTGVDYRSLMVDFKGLFDIFGALTPPLIQLQAMILPGEEPPAVVAGVAQKPDWESVTTAQIVPGISIIAESLETFSKSISSAVAAAAIYSDFADILRLKATALNEAATTIQDALDQLSAALNVSGAFILPIYGQFDKAGVQSQLLNSTGGPVDLPDDVQYSAGFMWLVSGGTTTPRDVLFDLFGLDKVNT